MDSTMSRVGSVQAGGGLSLQKDVRDFIAAAEKLLSPPLRTSPLTADECGVIADYLMTMTNAKHPWSKKLPIKYV